MHVLANKLGAFAVLLTDALETSFDGLSSSAAALLLTLHYRPGLTGTELARVTGIAQPTATRVLDGLVRRGWLQRQPRAGRSTPLLLTPAGEAQAQTLQAARLDAMDRLLAAVPEADRQALERLLDAVLAATTRSRAHARTTCRLCDHATCEGPLCPVGSRASELEQTTSPSRPIGEQPC